MKKVNWNTNATARDYADHETPFKVIKCPTGETIRLYWTRGKGTYGYQVIALVYFVGADNDVYYYKTGGCGFCKEGAATGAAFRLLGRAPRGWAYGNDLGTATNYCRYQKGGNLFVITKRDWLLIKNATKRRG